MSLAATLSQLGENRRSRPETARDDFRRSHLSKRIVPQLNSAQVRLGVKWSQVQILSARRSDQQVYCFAARQDPPKPLWMATGMATRSQLRDGLIGSRDFHRGLETGGDVQVRRGTKEHLVQESQDVIVVVELASR